MSKKCKKCPFDADCPECPTPDKESKELLPRPKVYFDYNSQYTGFDIIEANVYMDQCERLLAERDKTIADLRAELEMVDSALARRPAIASAPNRYKAIFMAFDEANKVAPLQSRVRQLERQLAAVRNKTLDEAARAVLGGTYDGDYYTDATDAQDDTLQWAATKLKKMKTPS